MDVAVSDFALRFLVHHSVLKLTQDEGPCDFWLWEDQYAFFITGVGINLLIKAAGGGSNVMFGIRRAMEDVHFFSQWKITVYIMPWHAYYCNQTPGHD